MDKHKKKAAVGTGALGKVEGYRHHVTDAEAACLTDPGNARRLQEVRTRSGADVQVDPNPSSVPDRKTVIIKGDLRQIDNAVRLLNQMTGSQEDVLQRAQEFWLKWVEAAFPDLDSQAYFLPPVYINRVPMTRQTIAGQDVLVLHKPSGQAGQSFKVAVNPSAAAQSSIPKPISVQDSDVRDDAAMQRILLSLQKMSQQNSEVFVAMSQLQFGEYLGEPCYAAAAAQVPLSTSLPPPLPKNWDKGDFDVLLIDRKYGFVVCEVKAVGDNVRELGLSQQDMENNIRKKLKQAIVQLDKAEAMLSHLVSDIASGLRITKTIAVPNLTAHQVEQAIAGDKQLTQDLCRCLGKPHTTDAAGAAGLCLTSDQLSDPKTPWDVSSHVLRELGHWWQRRVADAGPDSHMTRDVYKTVVAR
ncbi:uncharacterized protein LOC112554932 [Pomacea canaliculata]|uniref:uncharacterized protein LOC112554932 n=1 Tax=Pomacea canaliculata TaxID=400727 RepID=UPI000D73094B|nr:uncharacterized protein LOC112554932 [Pomacea canaliculata]XP_025078792.1 uncharacterized protein LOC112554932 [Pomacea canaliculata]XP_025078793.1 uncharacterized protein LOC112554932 [Pomacea canaliculata]XP_025078794.1 uncharacterized protein LOC112554932 [Pomacea canaliculata]XP_025078795.1 uncharacterized protein LOC112554932 [Pomacea canaliculata]XP_025078796.1 uncharacterized protein LOC112554932 [Pomacea canaliculata]